MVAVKVLRPEHEGDATVTARFAREAQMASRIDHPNVVRVLDAGRDGPVRYIVMDLVDGRDLKALIQERAPLPPSQAVWLTRQILLGLSAVHEAGLLHRDIKPQNILVTADLRPTLIDFGIARRIADADPGEAGVVLGSAAYMAPEQALGEPLGPSCDLYAVGVILFELLTGRVPFTGDDPHQVLLQQIHEPPPPMPGVDPHWEALVRHALAKQPSERFQSAAGMLAALDAAVSPAAPRELVPARDGNREVAAAGRLRHLVPAMATMVLLLTLLGWVVVATYVDGSGPSGGRAAPGTMTPASGTAGAGSDRIDPTVTPRPTAVPATTPRPGPTPTVPAATPTPAPEFADEADPAAEETSARGTDPDADPAIAPEATRPADQDRGEAGSGKDKWRDKDDRGNGSPRAHGAKDRDAPPEVDRDARHGPPQDHDERGNSGKGKNAHRGNDDKGDKHGKGDRGKGGGKSGNGNRHGGKGG